MSILKDYLKIKKYVTLLLNTPSLYRLRKWIIFVYLVYNLYIITYIIYIENINQNIIHKLIKNKNIIKAILRLWYNSRFTKMTHFSIT